MKRILLATDFSERSDRGLRRATLVAREVGAALTLMHAVDDDRPKHIVERARGDAEALLRQLRATLKDVDGLQSEVRLILGEASEAILLAVREQAPDLLVIGPHRRQIFRDIFAGTTAERTIRAVGCPVLMANAAPVGAYRHVMVTTDLSEGSRASIIAYLQLDLFKQARHSILHVFDAPMLRLLMSHEIPKDEKDAHLAEQQTNATRLLAEFRASANATKFGPILRYGAATASREILNAAAEAGADLVVVGTQSKLGIERFLLGSVAEKVLRDSPVDVLAIPPKRSPKAAP